MERVGFFKISRPKDEGKLQICGEAFIIEPIDDIRNLTLQQLLEKLHPASPSEKLVIKIPANAELPLQTQVKKLKPHWIYVLGRVSGLGAAISKQTRGQAKEYREKAERIAKTLNGSTREYVRTDTVIAQKIKDQQPQRLDLAKAEKEKLVKIYEKALNNNSSAAAQNASAYCTTEWN